MCDGVQVCDLTCATAACQQSKKSRSVRVLERVRIGSCRCDSVAGSRAVRAARGLGRPGRLPPLLDPASAPDSGGKAATVLDASQTRLDQCGRRAPLVDREKASLCVQRLESRLFELLPNRLGQFTYHLLIEMATGDRLMKGC